MPMLVAGSKSGHVHVIAAESGKALQSMMLGQPSQPRSSGAAFVDLLTARSGSIKAFLLASCLCALSALMIWQLHLGILATC